jgi:hypothetical protein
MSLEAWLATAVAVIEVDYPGLLAAVACTNEVMKAVLAQ